MVDKKLVLYIESQMSRGVSLEHIRKNLVSQGWSDYDINRALNLAAQPSTSPNPQTTSSNKEPIKKFSKLWIIAAVLVVVVIAGIFAFLMPSFMPASKMETQKPAASNLINCGIDMGCLIQASKSCKPASVTYNNTVELFGIYHTTTLYFEIKGFEGGKCTFYFRIAKIDLTFPRGTPQETIARKTETYKQLEGKEGTCKFNTDILTSALNRWKSGDYLTTDEWRDNGCQGTYY